MYLHQVNGQKTAYKYILSRPHPRALTVPKTWSYTEDIHQGIPNRPFLSIHMTQFFVNHSTQSNNNRKYVFEMAYTEMRDFWTVSGFTEPWIYI